MEKCIITIIIMIITIIRGILHNIDKYHNMLINSTYNSKHLTKGHYIKYMDI